MFKKKVHSHKKDKNLKKAEQGNLSKTLTSEELNEIAMQMSWSYGMIPFPYGFWYV